jgi:hypothetical protein
MTTLIKTQNSMYELDVENKQVRRLIGTKEPTYNQGNDGEYKQYSEIVLQSAKYIPLFMGPASSSDIITESAVGSILVIFWPNSNKYTHTSEIREVINN